MDRTLRLQYIERWEECKPATDNDRRSRKKITWLILKNHERYVAVASRTGVPWSVIGTIHAMECNLSFRKHLHNGDPLWRGPSSKPSPTTNVPKDRGPFDTWKESAVDALQLKLEGFPYDLSLMRVDELLFFIERYNGWGYQERGIPSQYLYSRSSLHPKGKYIADRRWDPEATSKQIGAVLILKELVSLSVDLSPPPLVTGGSDVAQNMILQGDLNRIGRLFDIKEPSLKIDGIPGPKTARHYELLFGTRFLR